jgi:large subunit ribosomal protein L15
MKLNAPTGSRKGRKVRGRGQGGGNGCTSGRGNKGQGVRSGFSQQIGFEGGQMPLARRIPKRGFNNSSFAKPCQTVNIGDLRIFADGDRVDYEALLGKGLVDKKSRYVKLLGNGTLEKKLHVIVNRASKKAVDEIKKLGGTVEYTGTAASNERRGNR